MEDALGIRRAVRHAIGGPHEQGLSARRWTVEEIFDPHLLDT
jgi:hypothetical protein